MFDAMPLPLLVATGLAAALVILVCGARMTGLADRIADRSGLGEAVIGAVLLGAATSFSGIIVSLTASLSGDASLAFSNGIGGIAAQTAFLALADALHRRVNLEHASAELANVFQCGVLLLLLSVPLVAFSGPEVAVWGVHPASAVLVVVYALGVFATTRLREAPMWHPVDTPDTRADTPGPGDDAAKPMRGLVVQFAALVAVMGVAGWVVAELAAVTVARYGLSASIVGALMTAVVTSLPELVTTLAAVRRGALQLAVGGIIGGNTFDILLLTISDIGYRPGSLYHAVGAGDLFWLSTALVMTAILLLGLLFREREGPGRIGLESAALLSVYAAAIAIQAL